MFFLSAFCDAQDSITGPADIGWTQEVYLAVSATRVRRPYHVPVLALNNRASLVIVHTEHKCIQPAISHNILSVFRVLISDAHMDN